MLPLAAGFVPSRIPMAEAPTLSEVPTLPGDTHVTRGRPRARGGPSAPATARERSSRHCESVHGPRSVTVERNPRRHREEAHRMRASAQPGPGPRSDLAGLVVVARVTGRRGCAPRRGRGPRPGFALGCVGTVFPKRWNRVPPYPPRFARRALTDLCDSRSTPRSRARTLDDRPRSILERNGASHSDLRVASARGSSIE